MKTAVFNHMEHNPEPSLFGAAEQTCFNLPLSPVIKASVQPGVMCQPCTKSSPEQDLLFDEGARR